MAPKEGGDDATQFYHPELSEPIIPKRFKSAFIIFSSKRHKELKLELAVVGEARKVCLFIFLLF
jgi:hypothetical protein